MIDDLAKFKADIIKHGQQLHGEIDIETQKIKSLFNEMDKLFLTALIKQEDKIRQTISKIKECISDIKLLLESNDVRFISSYKSRNADFRALPLKWNITFPKWTPLMINRKLISQQFSWISSISIEREERVYEKDSQNVSNLTYDKKIIANEPRIVSDRNTEYGIRSLSCLNDEDVWTCSNDSILRLYKLKGELVREIHTKSGNKPYDIAVTKNGDLVYTDNEEETVNILRNNKTQTQIRLRGWKPLGVCCSTFGDLLIVMNNDKISKVVRYSGHTKKQSIKYNEERQPLFSPGSINKYICENRNLDICVSDFEAHAVVVVNQVGKRRFTYTGNFSVKLETFNPVGITCDIRGLILIADINNCCIHIITKNGHLLRYIDSCRLYAPFGVCLDTTGSLLVSDYYSCYRGKIKSIQYYKLV